MRTESQVTDRNSLSGIVVSGGLIPRIVRIQMRDTDEPQAVVAHLDNSEAQALVLALQAAIAASDSMIEGFQP